MLHLSFSQLAQPGGLPGEWYDVLNRGTERRAIFRSTRLQWKIHPVAEQLTERFGVRLHGYALMANHYYLQLKSAEASLSKAIHWLYVSTACGSIEDTVASNP
jgi:hypothetical protein